jgi:hypothetical protein
VQGKGFESHFNIKKVYVSPVGIKRFGWKEFELMITGKHNMIIWKKKFTMG